MPKRVIYLRTMELHMNQPVSPGKTPRAQVAPANVGHVPLMPKEVTDLVKATSNLSQLRVRLVLYMGGSVDSGCITQSCIHSRLHRARALACARHR
jgi:hypothetical protein